MCDHEKKPYPKGRFDVGNKCLLKSCERKEDYIPMVELCTGLANSPASNTMLIQVAIQDNALKASQSKSTTISMPTRLLSERPGLQRVLYACIFDDNNKQNLLPSFINAAEHGKGYRAHKLKDFVQEKMPRTKIENAPYPIKYMLDQR